MYIVYHVLLLIAYFGIFIHCQGAGEGGGSSQRWASQVKNDLRVFFQLLT
jgi:hypothetical protein